MRFIDRDKILEDLRRVVSETKASHPEILRVFLIGSLARGDWTADSDADLVVVVRKEFPNILDRSGYQVHLRTIATDTLVYSEREFEELSQQHSSFLAQNLPVAIEL